MAATAERIGEVIRSNRGVIEGIKNVVIETSSSRGVTIADGVLPLLVAHLFASVAATKMSGYVFPRFGAELCTAVMARLWDGRVLITIDHVNKEMVELVNIFNTTEKMLVFYSSFLIQTLEIIPEFISEPASMDRYTDFLKFLANKLQAPQNDFLDFLKFDVNRLQINILNISDLLKSLDDKPMSFELAKPSLPFVCKDFPKFLHDLNEDMITFVLSKGYQLTSLDIDTFNSTTRSLRQRYDSYAHDQISDVEFEEVKRKLFDARRILKILKHYRKIQTGEDK